MYDLPRPCPPGTVICEAYVDHGICLGDPHELLDIKQVGKEEKGDFEVCAFGKERPYSRGQNPAKQSEPRMTKDTYEYAIVVHEPRDLDEEYVTVIRRANSRRIGGSDGIPAWENCGTMEYQAAFDLIHNYKRSE